MESEPNDQQLKQEYEFCKSIHEISTKAHDFMKEEKWNKAMELWKLLLVKLSDSHDAVVMSSECYIHLKNPQRALDELNKYMREDQTNEYAYYLHAFATYRSGNLESAIKVLNQLLERDPDNVKYKALFKLIRTIKKLKEEGNELFKKREYEQSISIYSQALELDPDADNINSMLHSNRAAAYMSSSQYEKAVDDCNVSLKYDPNHTKVIIRRARCLMSLERYEEAVADFEKALQQDEGNRDLRKEVKKARLELKKSKRKDYYKILGVGKDATPSEIKKGYRKMALIHHPDKNDDAEAEETFKNISEAYTVLSDPNKKQRYDSGADLEEEHGFGGHGFGGFSQEDLFAQFFSSHRGGGASFHFG